MTYQNRAVMAALSSQEKRTAHVRHKCFISYRQADDDEVGKFIEDFDDVFIAKVLGVSGDDADLIDSDDSDYVMRRIRELYLTDSTVTIVMVGACTWARKYVDWEIASSLRNDENSKRSGLFGVTLPSTASSDAKRLPDRLAANVLGGKSSEGYARWWKYPTSDSSLRTHIEDAFGARTTSERVDKIDNTAAMFKNNRQCP